MPSCYWFRHSNRRVSSADPKRQKELDEEKALLAKMRPHKRKVYKLQKQMVSEKELLCAAVGGEQVCCTTVLHTCMVRVVSGRATPPLLCGL